MWCGEGNDATHGQHGQQLKSSIIAKADLTIGAVVSAVIYGAFGFLQQLEPLQKVTVRFVPNNLTHAVP